MRFNQITRHECEYGCCQVCYKRCEEDECDNPLHMAESMKRLDAIFNPPILFYDEDENDD